MECYLLFRSSLRLCKICESKGAHIKVHSVPGLNHQKSEATHTEVAPADCVTIQNNSGNSNDYLAAARIYNKQITVMFFASFTEHILMQDELCL